MAGLNADEATLVEQIVNAHALILRASIAAVGPQRGLDLFDRAVARVHELAAADGLTPTAKQTRCRVDDLKPDEHGIVAVKHGLGSEQVAVKLFNADGVPRKHRRIGIPISPDETEVIVSHADVSYAEVEIVGES